MSNNNNSNNSTHKLVNLPHILLSNIVYNLTDNIDKIFFSLVCKRWFEDRNRYLLFDTNTLYRIEKYNSRIKLNSYRSIIFESLNKKKQCNMLVNPKTYYFERYDQIMDYDSIESIDEIDQDIVEVTIRSSEFEYREDSDKLLDRLYDLISKSNITSIKDCQTLKYVPANITSLVFDSTFNEALFKGCFPPNLKNLKFVGNISNSCDFKKEIGVGVLPDTLESFEMFNIYQILEPGVLPISLKILRILGDSEPGNYLKVGSLPPNLQEFFHNGKDFNIDSDVLPNSLITLENVPVSWMNSIKQLENLRSLMLVGYSGKVAGFKQESLDGLNIKRLCLNSFPYRERPDTHRDIPFGVETLELLYHNKINQKSLPSSVKTLVVDNMQNFIRPGMIPNSVNHLIILNSATNNIEEGILPDSVQNIELKQLLFPITKMVNNISFNVDDDTKFSFRKLDDQYYIVFGHQYDRFIARLFHKSMFLEADNAVETLKYKI
ncbi:hypothetical protein PPL_10806 [Heterostelium album PN500]|uniref:F-box domain-containing protein n=1 Tax=Heterostelium pallidum (strain ATCC 26659 / Pp 5 / PN500) TaxID=670386 RepID=D3BS14_HETP5|nr:hypothetical protein PPL_10806 [Heterostelium album PN500]EFA75751.1 hypothetical protein PPL_10806 [Heterostelium album PN500]|eukprot:XP_020427885.1 hypothetical protein PPL_10806 [Heterostelium album PN500]